MFFLNHGSCNYICWEINTADSKFNFSLKEISSGKLDTKVPNIEADEEIKILNENFNNMIERLKTQQDKLLTAERFSAWETVARKLAHEIKNPLTPIQLSIDRLRDKYSEKLKEDKKDFTKYLETINRQITDIKNLVNEFSILLECPPQY